MVVDCQASAALAEEEEKKMRSFLELKCGKMRRDPQRIAGPSAFHVRDKTKAEVLMKTKA